ncbi:NAD(P)H-dependent oxidoreductase [Patiriisocius hiemis]|uniref:NAD(P)H-dependent oxidoreductase n=1 Tax=Patiriisocius hiemis TaxID=3075604 RepID=A0ABU2Y8M9_9FLAO|nr:NAD(P)H-dependent oxidoreductase [Constantimarinum sp. W242]MDT0554529.1 NAD(P)H-dependent oxidoreductase [Constantimarinum sp. W242]
MSINTIEKLKWRYATKKFDSAKLLPEAKINTLKQAFNLTATSYGLQPLKMIAIHNKTLQKELVPLTMEQQQVADASHVLVLCTETSITSNYIQSYFKKVADTRKTPKEILNPFETFLVESFSEKPDAEVKTWMQKQAYIALGNLLTICAFEEIDACPIEGFDPLAYDEKLQLKEKGLESVLVLAVGYRAKDDTFSKMKKIRRGVDTVVINM